VGYRHFVSYNSYSILLTYTTIQQATTIRSTSAQSPTTPIIPVTVASNLLAL